MFKKWIIQGYVWTGWMNYFKCHFCVTAVALGFFYRVELCRTFFFCHGHSDKQLRTQQPQKRQAVHTPHAGALRARLLPAVLSDPKVCSRQPCLPSNALLHKVLFSKVDGQSAAQTADHWYLQPDRKPQTQRWSQEDVIPKQNKYAPEGKTSLLFLVSIPYLGKLDLNFTDFFNIQIIFLNLCGVKIWSSSLFSPLTLMWPHGDVLHTERGIQNQCWTLED